MYTQQLKSPKLNFNRQFFCRSLKQREVVQTKYIVNNIQQLFSTTLKTKHLFFIKGSHDSRYVK